jgi:Mg-chelatase subunit ChlD
MSKPTTHVLMVVDASGSMAPLANNVRGGFNAYIADLRKDADRRYRVTAALFNTELEPLCTAARLKDVPVLDDMTYRPGGGTALHDAVAFTVSGFDAYAPELGEDDRAIVVVQTDGEENSSKEFAGSAGRAFIANLIRAREATGKWSFVFIGAGPDTWTQAAGMGFAAASTVSVAATSAGTQSTYTGLAAATRSYSRGATGAEASGIVAAAAGGDDDD